MPRETQTSRLQGGWFSSLELEAVGTVNTQGQPAVGDLQARLLG